MTRGRLTPDPREDELGAELEQLVREAGSGQRDPFDVIDQIIENLLLDLEKSVIDNSENLALLARQVNERHF